MNEYKKLELGSLVKMVVDSRGITNGSIDVLSFEYDINSDIEKIVDYVENNDLTEVMDEIDIIKNQNENLENTIKDYALDISILQSDTSDINNKINEYNNTVIEQYGNIISKILEVLQKLQPKIVEKEIIKLIPYYTEIRTTYFKGIKSIEESEKEQIEIIKNKGEWSGKHGWYEYSWQWMVLYRFGKESLFLKKKLWLKQRSKNPALAKLLDENPDATPGQYWLYDGPFYRPELFHQLYDK